MDENRASIKITLYRPMKVVETRLPTLWCTNDHDVYGMPFVHVVVIGKHLR